MLEDSNDIGRRMNKKQKETLVLALAEKGKTYREITREAGVSPNTIKAVLSKSGLDESTSIHSRAFELFSEGKTPLQVAITLNLEAEQLIQYHQQYFMLLGCTEFTKVYLQIKDNPWPYVDLANLVHNSQMGDGEIVELLKIANRYLPRVRLELDRTNEELNSTKAALNSWKAAISNEVRVYQDFCDRNLKLKNREDEFRLSISEKEYKEEELQKTITELERHIGELQENNTYRDNLNSEVKQENIIPTSDVSMPNMVIDHHQNENETLHYPSQVEP